MLAKNFCFAISSYQQACEVIKYCHKNKILPIIYIKYFIANGLGPEWIKEFETSLKKKFSKNRYKICIDCKKNYGLLINLIEKKIDYIIFNTTVNDLKKIKKIAHKNNVSLNPKFSVIEISKIKNIDSKIEKLK